MKKKYYNGPDQVVPAKNYFTADPDEPVKLRMIGENSVLRAPISIPTLLKKTALKYPDFPALCYKNENHDWQTISYKQYRKKVLHFTKIFIKLGLTSRYSVSIMAHNCPQYSIGILAAIHAGGIASGIYTTSSPKAMLDVLNDSRTNILIVADDDQLEKALTIRSDAKYLKSIIQIFPTTKTSEYKSKVDEYYTWKELEEQDVTQQQAELNERLSNISVNECCTLVFTSGTTEKPKGVMLSHDNITSNVFATVQRYQNVCIGKESTVSYLPICHIAALFFDVYLPIEVAMTVYFFEKNSIKNDFIESLRSVQPTRMFVVPRILEKIYEFSEMNTKHLKFSLERIGLSNIRGIYCGGALFALEVKNYFIKRNVAIVDIYGLSETTGPHTMTSLNCLNHKSVGKVLDGSEVQVNYSAIENECEVLLRGRNIFMGYIGMEHSTKDVLEEDGWLHTGDVGYVDEEGFVYITGRLKELIITAGGYNVAPSPIENKIKAELSIISNICLVGDNQKYLSALVTLKTEIDSETGEPLDDLKSEVRLWMKNLGLNYIKLSEVLAAGPDPKVLQQISEAIDRVNSEAITHIHTVKKFVLLPKDFSINTGELSSTFKLKRKSVKEKYEGIIKDLYSC